MERTFDGQGQVTQKSVAVLPSFFNLCFAIRYFWMSDDVLFSRQKGVFRVNCIDCLDRTNVVQVQSSFLGSLLPEGILTLIYDIVCVREIRFTKTAGRCCLALSIKSRKNRGRSYL